MQWTIEELIPQRPPFVFVDKVMNFSEGSVTTSFEIKQDGTLVFDGFMQEAGLIENIAQSAAALEGCNAKSNNCKVKVGFIGSVKNLEISRSPKVGEILETQVNILTNAMGVNVAEGIVKSSDEIVAKCVLNIFLKED
ncbi:hypothetical protein [Plebeiibacterium sediminum]|uniref:3-hydroxymyristoyl/3-hydroxydecanoyl-(Acyl carrier protein) dehydratase n=1 Tax=Plebeiibacterium sediminum TaxID=2992112 RepID=A0AAE3M2B0_9BACT|nr:hypothetical protein [Plebeiobacterium sediminum]MCW3785547.1 hypothetical protein [Plebeiobacterium sediminum]